MKRLILAVVTSMTFGATPVIAVQKGHGAASKPQHVAKITAPQRVP